MTNYKITLQPQSYLLCSNAESSGAFDSQFVFDENGFPYFPAKTFKGLLRESMIEVLEMQGKESKQIREEIARYFGTEGDKFNNGLLNISNLYLSNYDSTDAYFGSKNKIKKHKIQQYYLSQIQQTALGENEIAKNTSLRYYAVLNHARAKGFETTIILDENQTPILQQALRNLRYAGTRRNRGFGKIVCEIDPITELPQTPQATKVQWSDSFDAIKVKITLKESIVLGTQNTDTNTVNSQDFVAGNQVLGMLAWAYKNQNKGKDFETLFLENPLIFEPCYPNAAKPLPLAIHKEKYQKEAVLHNILSKNDTFDEVTKTIGGFINDEFKQVSINKHFNFHASRTARSSGRSTKDAITGGIFYYESIDKGTVFEGKIRGNKAKLAKLYAAFSNDTLFRLGKSKSSQYGEVAVELTPYQSNILTKIPIGNYYMVVESPLLLFNENGFPAPNKNTLHEALKCLETIEIASANIVAIEQYNSTWLAKTGKMPAFKEGSTFKVTLNQAVEKHQTIGEWQEKGFGKIVFYDETEMSAIVNAYSQDFSANSDDMSLPLILEPIQKDLEKQKHESELKIKAYKDAYYKVNRMSNSLISRILNVLETEDTKLIKAFFANIKDKQAGRKLETEHIFDELYKARQNQLPFNEPIKNLTDYVTYWRAYFLYLRKSNK